MDATFKVDPARLERSLARSGLTFEEAVEFGWKAAGIFDSEAGALASGDDGPFATRELIAKYGAGAKELSALLAKVDSRPKSAI